MAATTKTLKAKKAAQDGVKLTRSQKQNLRKKQYKKVQLAKALTELGLTEEDRKNATRKQKRVLNIKYQKLQQRKKKDPAEVRELVETVKRQQKEIKLLRDLLLTNGIPVPETAEITATVEAAVREASSAEIQDQLQQEAGSDASAEEVEDEVGDATMEDAEAKEEADEIVEYPTLPTTETADAEVGESPQPAAESVSPESVAEVMPTVESEEVAAKSDDTPRQSSADSHAGTPRNLRRSPRKKRRSFAGHTY